MIHNEDSNNSQLPPQSNPILESYLAFRNGTPFVTRNMLASQVICFGLSFFLNMSAIFANLPYLSLFKGQLWRILTSPLLCDRFLSLLIAFFSFSEPGRRLERSIGSTPFLCLVTTLGSLTNLAYIVLALLVTELTGNDYLLKQPTSGIWQVVFGIIAIECSRAPPQSTRRLFFFPVQVEYYPLALFAFFCFFTGTFDWSHILSIGIGYAYEHGYLDSIKPTSQRCKRWEERYLNGLGNIDGWVQLDQIVGSGAWSTDANEHASSGLFSHVQNRLQQASSNAFANNSGNESSTPTTTTSFPSTGGHVLGGASRRTAQSPVDPRRARLQAIERRMKAASSEEGDVV